MPLALSAAPSSRGAVADVVVDGPVAASTAEAMAVAVAREEAPLPTADSEPAVRVRPAVDVACYSSNQVGAQLTRRWRGCNWNFRDDSLLAISAASGMEGQVGAGLVRS